MADANESPRYLWRAIDGLPLDQAIQTAVKTEKLDLYELQVAEGDELNHLNFVEIDFDEKVSVVSVFLNVNYPDEQNIPALRTHSRGTEEFTIHLPSDAIASDIPDIILAQLPQSQAAYMVGRPQAKLFAQELRKIEQVHSQATKNLQIGVIFAQEGQIDSELWMANEVQSDKFWEFMDFFGERVSVDHTWKQFRGDIQLSASNTPQAYFCQWEGLDVIYHLAPLMDSDDRRRLIGNDILIIIFVEEGAAIDMPSLSGLGQVPQCICIVQPVGDLWQISFHVSCSLTGVPNIPPLEPVDIITLKHVVLTFFFNGLIQTKQCPPLNRLFFRPRERALTELMKRYSGVSIDVEEDRSQKRSRKGLKKSNTVSMQVPQEKRRTRRHSWTRNMTLPSLSLSESKTPSPSSSNSSSPVSSLSSSLTAIRKKKRYSNMLGNTYCGCDYEKIDKNSPNFEIYLELNYRKHFMSIPEKGSRRFCTLTTDPEKATLFQSMPCSQTNWTRHKNVSPVHLCGSVGLSRGGGFQKTALFYGRFHLHILSPCVLLSPDTLGFWYVWALIPKKLRTRDLQSIG
eukprot:TRINITY_DN5167_c0_g1_i6.p1 TRINITY_DN5167_c0_g1~~TRINITY_DN5167_c0_g1_i6.p1  ORF type:complete len:569 (-),score=83.18 TRINITY_DN5167_c0_g1_i6:915-2621(-)